MSSMEEVIIFDKVTNQFDACYTIYIVVHNVVLAIPSKSCVSDVVLIHKNVKIKKFSSDFWGEHI